MNKKQALILGGSGGLSSVVVRKDLSAVFLCRGTREH